MIEYDEQQRAYIINGATVAEVMELAGDHTLWTFGYGGCGSHEVLLYTESVEERRKRREEERIAAFEEEKRQARERIKNRKITY